MNTLISPEISPRKLHDIFINSLHFSCSITLAVSKPYITTAVPHGHSTGLPGPGTVSLCFYSVQVYFMLYCSFLCSPGVLQKCSFLCTYMAENKDLYCSHHRAHGQLAFKQWIPIKSNGSYAHKSPCSRRKERSNLAGAQGLQDVWQG